MTQLIYRLYQLLIAAPIILILTILTAIVVTIGCNIGDGDFWGYYPGKLWAQSVIRVLLLPVEVEGRENIQPHQSYVFVSNHQGAFDIFLIYGFLCRNFKWMMKKEIKQMPLIGMACDAANHIFVENSTRGNLRKTYDKARKILRSGMSLVVFPEGARTFDGKMITFKNGAFLLAEELKLPIIPITINGTFEVMPRTKDMKWVTFNRLKMTIHPPVQIAQEGPEGIKECMRQCHDIIHSGLEERYKK